MFFQLSPDPPPPPSLQKRKNRSSFYYYNLLFQYFTELFSIMNLPTLWSRKFNECNSAIFFQVAYPLIKDSAMISPEEEFTVPDSPMNRGTDSKLPIRRIYKSSLFCLVPRQLIKMSHKNIDSFLQLGDFPFLRRYGFCAMFYE